MSFGSLEFAGLGEAARTALGKGSTRLNCRPNEFIYIQDDDADYLYSIVAGHVRLTQLMEDGSALLCAVLPPGESFGELGFFERGTHVDTATALGNVTLARISSRAFTAIAGEHGEVTEALARLIARRYRSYIDLTRNLSLKSLPARLAQSLLRLVDNLGEERRLNGRTAPCLAPLVTQSDLGIMARGSRGNVNRALKTWERAGWIAMNDRCIFVLDRARLEALALEEES